MRFSDKTLGYVELSVDSELLASARQVDPPLQAFEELGEAALRRWNSQAEKAERQLALLRDSFVNPGIKALINMQGVKFPEGPLKLYFVLEAP